MNVRHNVPLEESMYEDLFSNTGHSSSVITCSKCGCCFPESSLLNQHFQMEHHPDQRYICKICNNIFPCRDILFEHLYSHTNKKMIKCQYCDKVFENMILRHTHEYNHITKELERTHIEQFAATVENSFDQHWNDSQGFQYSKSENFLVNEDEFFEIEDGFENHNLIYVEEENSNNCELYPPELEREDVYLDILNEDEQKIDIMELRQGTETRNMSCLADAEPPTKGRKKKEPKEITKSIYVNPEIVKKVAPQKMYKPEVKRPVKVNSQNLDWIIDAVAKGKNIDESSPHIRKKPVIGKCQFCEKIFKYPSKLAAHERVHTGEKPYICTICQKGFSQSTPMRMHMRRHLNQKLFICCFVDCKSSFISGALLNQHYKKKHALRQWVCACSRSFKNQREFVNHEMSCDWEQKEDDDEIIDEEYYFAQDDTTPYIV
uniref:C2H2-type domain-containing protein n=1 Tax=Parastrongyloides trichosuri TaxID=131310 RepID=A0A0N4ZMA7_PARTI